MQHLTPVEIANWLALYAATGVCCAMAIALSNGFVARQLYREQPWRRAHSVRGVAMLLPHVVALAEALFLFDTGDARHRRLLRAVTLLVMTSEV